MKKLLLGNLLKQILPKSLFGRSLLIITTPLILLQIVLVIIFFDRHWDSITGRMVHAVGSEVRSLVRSARLEDPDGLDALWRWSYAHFSIEVTPILEEQPVLIDKLNLRTLTSTRIVRQTFTDSLQMPFWIDSVSDPEHVSLVVDTAGGDPLPHRYWRFTFSKKRISSPTTYIFMLWMVGSSIILTTIAILFMRNQIKPIRQLAIAAKRFGLGMDVNKFRPTGATEVRQASKAFIDMKQRIDSHINQRTQLLAGVSHDLRTPLTRMRLELALLQDKTARANMEKDVADMERLIEGYLDFARDQQTETTESHLLQDMLTEVADDFDRQGRRPALDPGPDIRFPMQRHGLKRAVTNLVKNALRHADNVKISAAAKNGKAIILVDDDGPGIDEAFRKTVFEPFNRLDESRNLDSGGVGLGLTIVRDVMRRHSGKASLEDSPMGGLRARLELPMDISL